MKDFLLSIGIDYAGYYDESGNYIVDLPTADAYAVVYSKLSNSDKVEEFDSKSTDNLIIIDFDSLENDFELSLVMDLEKDNYYLSIKGDEEN